MTAFKRDQYGVVWHPKGFMPKETYEHVRAALIQKGTVTGEKLPKYEDLPEFDNQEQNIVDVEGEKTK